MSDAPAATPAPETPAAPAAPPAAEPAAPEATLAAPAAAEPASSEVTPAEPEAPKEPPPPPRVAEARKMLAKAEKAQADAKAKLEAAEAKERELQGEAERLKGLIQQSRSTYELGRDIKGLQGPGATKKILARLKADGIQLDLRELAAAVLEPDDDDRPLTKRELLQIEEERRKAAETAEAERKGKEDKARSEAKTKAEENLLTLVQSKAPTAAKALSRMGAHGRGFLIEQAYKAYAELMAQGRPHGLEAIADELEVRMRRDYPEWAPAAPAEGALSGGSVTPIGSKKPSALSNASTTKAPPPKPLSQMSEDERWAQYERNMKKGAK